MHSRTPYPLVQQEGNPAVEGGKTENMCLSLLLVLISA